MKPQSHSKNRTVNFPLVRDELIAMAKVDQAEVREHFRVQSLIKSQSLEQQKLSELMKKCHIRAHRIIELLDDIKSPTIDNIGPEGCEAVVLIAQHSYLDVMKKILAMFEKEFNNFPSNICYQYIPPLYDRIMILEHKKQLFGTQWTVDKDGNPFLIHVDQFENMNKRRAKYGLDSVRRPVNLAVGADKYPLGKGLAIESDQKQLTSDEYEAYSRNYLKSLI